MGETHPAMANVAFLTFGFQADRVVHVVAVNRRTGRMVAMQSAAISGTRGRVFGTTRKSFWAILQLGVKKSALQQQFLRAFEEACRREGVRTLIGSVPTRLWQRSYRHWTGFRDTGHREQSAVGERVVIEKRI